MHKRPLLWQLYPAYLFIAILGLLAVTWYATHTLKTFQYEQVAQQLTHLARTLSPQFPPLLQAQDYPALDRLCKSLGRDAQSRITVILPSGQVVGDSNENPIAMDNHLDRPEFQQALSGDPSRALRFSGTLEQSMMYVALPVLDHDKTLGALRTALSVKTIDQTLAAIHTRIVWAGALIVALLALVSLWLTRRIIRPLEQMKLAAQRFAAGDFDLKIPVPDSTELAQLAATLNEMAGHLNGKIRNITEQKNESDAVLAAMAEGVLAFDPQGRLLSLNPAAAGFLHLPAEQARGRSIEELTRNRDLHRFVELTLARRQATETEITFPGDSTTDFFRLHGAALTDNLGRPRGAVIVMYDITRVRRLENMRRDFVANVSHELRTPLTSIKGFAETLREGALDDPQKARHFLSIVARQIDRLNAIIEDILCLSRIEDEAEKGLITFENVPLPKIFQSVLEATRSQAAEKQIRIDVFCDDRLHAHVNPVLLEQAVLNLLTNAIHYSNPDTSVVLRAARTENQILISVQDHGPGIEKQHHQRIFERFYVVDKARSRKVGGTGLGLAIVKHIAHAHHGSVDVQSQPGQGSTFTLRLPAHHA